MKRYCTLFLLVSAASFAMPASVPRSALLGGLPLRFEENRGRDSHANVKYIAQGENYRLSLAPQENWLEWKGQQHTARVQTRLVGGNTDARMETEGLFSSKVNYFVGAASQWRTDVPGFERVRYREVYPGIDLIFHGEQGRLEYDFVVAPGSDPANIQLQLSGQKSASVAEDGDLVISTDAGDIRWKRPEIYQEITGTRKPIQGQFVMVGKDTVRFEIGTYNASQPLVIDPVLKYSTYIGSKGNDSARGVAVDGAGNVYVTGATSSNDLPVLSAYQNNFGGGTAGPMTGDGFVAKFSPTGTLLYLTYLGGSQDDGVAAIAVDAAGNAYITGGTSSPDFPTVNPYQAAYGGVGGSAMRTGDAFVAKLGPTGNKLLYSTYLGGNQDDIGLAIAIDRSGNAYVAGATASTNFPVFLPIQRALGGVGGEPIRHPERDLVPEWEPGDAFVAKLDPSGSKLIYSTYLGGNQDDVALSIAVDSANNAYVGGCTISGNFPVTTGALQHVYGGAEIQNEFFHLGDGFVSKITPAGDSLVYSTYFGGPGDDCITGIAVDSTGSVYMTGSTTTDSLPTTTGAFQLTYHGYFTLPLLVAMDFGDAFVGKLDPTGSKISYLSYLGGRNNDGGTAIAVDSLGNAYVTGFTDSADFPIKGSALQTTWGGDGGIGLYLFYGDAFLSVVNPTGTALLYSSFFGGNEDERTFGIAVDTPGNVYLVGNTVSTNLPTTPNALRTTFGGFDGHVPGAMRGDAYLAIFSGFLTSPPVVSGVVNAESGSATIAGNTWVTLTGTNLSSTTRPWGNSDFVNAQLPTALDGVSVTMNGKKAFVYYVSPMQINVLTPPDLGTGPIQVQVTSGGNTSAAFTVQAQALSPAFFVINGGPYVVATHADGSLIGPTTLYPGATTPASSGETIILYANGFGQTDTPVVSGAVTQAGNLTPPPTVQINGQNADVAFAGVISPGLYQFNITVPSGVVAGDNKIVATYGGVTTQANALITLR